MHRTPHRTQLALAIRRRQARERRIIRVMAALCVVVGLAVLAFAAALVDPDRGLGHMAAHGSQAEAYIRARECVAESLLSPASAQFPWLPDSARFDGAAWHVAGHVDSQNAFGALIRSHWRCEIEKRNGEWHCRALTVDGSRAP